MLVDHIASLQCNNAGVRVKEQKNSLQTEKTKRNIVRQLEKGIQGGMATEKGGVRREGQGRRGKRRNGWMGIEGKVGARPQ